METDLDINNHQLLNTIHVLNTNNGNVFSLNGCDKLITPNYAEIMNIKVMYFNVKTTYPSIQLKVKHGFLLQSSEINTSTTSTQLLTINTNLKLTFGHLSIKLLTDIANEEILMLVECKYS